MSPIGAPSEGGLAEENEAAAAVGGGAGGTTGVAIVDADGWIDVATAGFVARALSGGVN
jgi:hypothetical protein